MEPALVVFLTACSITVLSLILSRVLGKDEEISKWSLELKRYNNLSKDALRTGQRAMYASFRKKVNEASEKYYSALCYGAIIGTIPHILALLIFEGLYSQDIIKFGFNVLLLGEGVGLVSWYIFCGLIFYFGIFKKLKNRISVLSSVK